MAELGQRMRAALDSCLELPAGSKPLLVSHGMALGCLLSTLLGLPPTRSGVCVCVTVLYHGLIIRKARGWLLVG